MRNTKEQKNAILTSDSRVLKAFPFLRTFTIISFVSIVVASLFLGLSLRKIIVDSLIESEERANVALAQLLGNTVWSGFEDYILSSRNMSGDEIRSHPKTFLLKRFIVTETTGLNIFKIKIYNLDGLIVFSTDLKQIGESKKSQPDFISAKNGSVVSKLYSRDKIYAKNELIDNRSVIASYVPIKQKQGKIVSVFEVYKDVTEMLEKINSLQVKILFGVFGTAIILFIILFLTVRRADNIIKKYNDAQEAVTEKIRGVAFHDHLTGLPNRVLFVDRLEHAIDVATRSDKLVALMFIDLDRFKQVNDNLGHEAGDKLLCQFSSRLLEVVRPSDTVSRISGDEFTIILENLSNIEFSTIVSQRILSRMEAPFLVGKNKIFITCSIGLSIYPFNDDDVESLIKKADAAMFFSKSFGRNTFHYYSPDMLEHGSQRYELEIELNTALKEQQFYLVFQPKIDLINWTMQGVETQIHWNHPDKGFIEPEIFMPMLEETGLIIHVGEWVLRESCRLSKQWQNEGLPPIRIAVNISSIQLNHPDFLDMVSSILNSTNLEPKYLELELSERRLIDDQDNNIKNMKTLRDKGIHLTIDDFGTGFSSLSYLSKLPIETLKINKSFITDMMSDTQKRSITTAIISFAHSLKLNIIVDGIETREQLMFITAMRCSLAQGSLISNYLDYDEFYEVYKSGGDFSRLIENRPTST